MIKILFLQNTISEIQGVMYLSKKLKASGYNVGVLISGNKNKIARYIVRNKIDVACFSIMYGHQFWATEISKSIREASPSTRVLWGGLFPTFNPDYLLKVSPAVDAFCVGEAEGVVVDLVEAALGRSGFGGIKGAVYVESGALKQNSICDLTDIENLSADRDLYFSHNSILRNNSTKIFVCSRGCIGDCSYCYNSRMKQLYRDNPGRYLRSRSPESMLAEIKYVKAKYGMKRIFFYDDILVFDKKWSFDFLPRLKSEVCLPYMCYTRADLVDKESVKLLKDTGCYMLSFGLESGNEDLRRLVLNKKISNETIIKAAELIKSYGLSFNTTNMMGFPHETYNMGLETIALNIKIGAIGSCNILNPFPGTQLFEYCRQNNLFEEDYFKDGRMQIHYYPMIKNPDRQYLGNLERLFQLAVFFPRIMYPVVKRIARLRPNPLFDFIFVLMQFFYVRCFTEKYSLSFMLRYYTEKMSSVFRHQALKP